MAFPGYSSTKELNFRGGIVQEPHTYAAGDFTCLSLPATKRLGHWFNRWLTYHKVAICVAAFLFFLSFRSFKSKHKSTEEGV